MHDDPVLSLSLDHHLVASPETGSLESLDRKRYLMLTGDARYYFNVKDVLSPLRESSSQLGVFLRVGQRSQ